MPERKRPDYSAARVFPHCTQAPHTLPAPPEARLAAFGDEVRDGWWPPAVLAFVVSVVAGVVLCGVDGRLDRLDVDLLDDPDEV